MSEHFDRIEEARERNEGLAYEEWAAEHRAALGAFLQVEKAERLYPMATGGPKWRLTLEDGTQAHSWADTPPDVVEREA